MSTTPDSLEGSIVVVVHWVKLGVEILGAGLVTLGVCAAIVPLLRNALAGRPTEFTATRLVLARYLALALEFELGADILGTAVSPLLTGRSGGEVAKTIRWWAARTKKLDVAARTAIDKTCAYLADRTRTRLLGYQDALRDGLPIATGVIEGACRYVVKDRMERTGARWSLTGAEAVLRLRAIRASKDFDAYWVFHLEREKERNHASRYEDGNIPDPLPPPKPRLKRVK